MNSFTQRASLYLLRAYKWAISPMFPPACRYTPTCSEYAMEAIERFGIVRGGLKAVSRLLRCHPFVEGGYDPVTQGPARPEYQWASRPTKANETGCPTSGRGCQKLGVSTERSEGTNDQRPATNYHAVL